MNLNEYQSLANRTLRPDDSDNTLLHAGMGMATEAGEFLDTLKKHRFYGKPIDVGNLIEECGDLLWYCAAAARGLGVSLDDIAQANIAKLRARFPDGFAAHDAMHRDLAAEAVAMTGTYDAGPLGGGDIYSRDGYTVQEC
jgi:NTP pyrophosphatase (non-canonical NTP hydrolase)